MVQERFLRPRKGLTESVVAVPGGLCLDVCAPLLCADEHCGQAPPKAWIERLRTPEAVANERGAESSGVTANQPPASSEG